MFLHNDPDSKMMPFALAIIAINAVVAGTPVLNYIFGLMALASYPVLFYTSGRSFALTTAAISTVAAGLIHGFAVVISMLLSVTVPGLILGTAMLAGKRASKAIVLAFLPSFAILLLFVANIGIYKEIFFLAVDEVIIQLSQVPGMVADIEKTGEDLRSYGHAIFTLMPSLILLTGIFNVFLAYYISQKLLKRSGCIVEALPRFNDWRPGYKLVGLFILGLFLTVSKLAGSEHIGWNILVFTGIIYFVSGLAVVESFFKASRIPLFFKILFYAGVFFAQLFSLVVLAGVGLFDSWFNFRSRRAE